MKTIEITADVGPDRTIVVQLPDDVLPGRHRVVVVIDEQRLSKSPFGEGSELPLLSVDSWPAGLSLRREDMYDDWGR